MYECMVGSQEKMADAWFWIEQDRRPMSGTHGVNRPGDKGCSGTGPLPEHIHGGDRDVTAKARVAPDVNRECQGRWKGAGRVPEGIEGQGLMVL